MCQPSLLARADAWLRSNARGRYGGICQELAAGIGRALINAQIAAGRLRCVYGVVFIVSIKIMNVLSVK